MGSMVAARRTDSSYPQFLASTNPSDLVVQPFTTPGLLARLRPPACPAAARQRGRGRGAAHRGHPDPRAGSLGTVLLAHVQLAATISGGLFASQDRVTITAGRRPDPARPDEVVATVDAARLLHLHVGSRLRVALIGSYHGRPRRAHRPDGRRDRGAGHPGPAGQHRLGPDRLPDRHARARREVRLLLRERHDHRPARDRRAQVQHRPSAREYDRLLATSPYISPSGSELYVYLTSAIEAEAQRAIRPEAIALAVFGLIAGLAALITRDPVHRPPAPGGRR